MRALIGPKPRRRCWPGRAACVPGVQRPDAPISTACLELSETQTVLPATDKSGRQMQRTPGTSCRKIRETYVRTVKFANR